MSGVHFVLIGKRVRSVYHQFGGGTILADECKCRVEYPKDSFHVVPSVECPVDEHKQQALNNQSE